MRYTSKRKQRKSRFLQRLLLLFIASVILLLGILTKFVSYEQQDKAYAVMTTKLPLSTLGSKILDATGRPIILKGVNWFGLETEVHAPHGLWQRDYKDMLAEIRRLGYNLIRLPYSVATLRSENVSGIDFSIGSNIELEDKTPLEVMDLIIEEAERQGLMILLDSHRLNDQRIPELWYGDGFTEEDWIDTWKMLAQRYKNQANVIGADLKNEPHGKASWGTNDVATDWRLAAERAGNAILSINPNWLIVVEGVEKNVPGQKLQHHWQGGNLEGVKRYPVRLSRRNKLVYSPHEYGQGVYNQPYFSDRTFPKNLIDRWQIGFNYISSQNLAPILIGEFGGRQVDTISKEGIWQNEFVKYIRKNNLSFAYWSWNPNSSDTGGILLDDWESYDLPKLQLLSQLVTPVQAPQALRPNNSAVTPSLSSGVEAKPVVKPNNSAVAPSSSSGVEAKPVVKPNNSAVAPSSSSGVVKPNNSAVSSSFNTSVSQSSNRSRQLTTTTNIYSNWQTGFCVSFKITNVSDTTVNNWQLKFNMNQAAINNAWNANFQPQSPSKYIATPLDWGKMIEPNQSRDLGFCANKLGSDYEIKEVEVTS